MKINLLKPILVDGKVVSPGEFETTDPHAKELLRKGIAAEWKDKKAADKKAAK